MAKAAVKKKTVARREWTAADERELRRHSNARTPVVKISKALKRSPGALRQRRVTLESRSATASAQRSVVSELHCERAARQPASKI
jgi:hypothetical protein